MNYCVHTALTRVGGIDSFAERIGGFATSLQRVGGDIHCSATKTGGIEVVATKISGLSCAMYQVCKTNIRVPYLEINPEVVWLLAGHTENEVYSNTRWHID